MIIKTVTNGFGQFRSLVARHVFELNSIFNLVNFHYLKFSIIQIELLNMLKK
jgi:hypothetical protein